MTTVAFLYDRALNSNAPAVLQRIEHVAHYAAERGWDCAGRWVDAGDDALTNTRPQFDAMVEAIRAAGADTDRVCLVASWGRLSHDGGDRAQFARSVLTVGAAIETCDGDRRYPGGGYTTLGRLTPGSVLL